MIWENLTSAAIDQLDRQIPVILPIAAIEQHGPHLPLATDKIINEHFCRQLENEISSQVLFLPTIAVTCSRHHMDFPGTLTVSHETLSRQVQETLSAVVEHGFRNLIIFNSHGGNQAVAGVILEQFGAAHPECRVAVATWWRIAADQLLPISETGPGGIGHACEFETSLVLLAAPDLVDAKSIEGKHNTPTFAWAEGDLIRGAQASLFRTMKQMTPNGAYGDPRAASREKGVAITEIVVRKLRQLITDLTID
ncbi:MAG: creatininase family protein [Pirellulaceae bacterium]|nr:creatininase family protein [Planctomycetales bacterium]